MRLLLVEDSGELCHLLHKILTRRGYEVTAAYSAEEALKICKGKHKGFDLLLADVVLPGLTGPQLAEKLRQLGLDFKSIFISGYADRRIPDETLLKPFSPQELLDKVESVAGEKTGEKEFSN